MASFLDKTGLTKFWELIKQYLNNNFTSKSTTDTLTQRLDHLSTNTNLSKYSLNFSTQYPEPNKLEFGGNDHPRLNSFSTFGNILINLFFDKLFYLFDVTSNGESELPIEDVITGINLSSEDRVYLGRVYRNNNRGINRNLDVYLDKTTDPVKYNISIIPVEDGKVLFSNGLFPLQYINNLQGIVEIQDPLIPDLTLNKLSSNLDDYLPYLENKSTEIKFKVEYANAIRGLLKIYKKSAGNNSLELIGNDSPENTNFSKHITPGEVVTTYLEPGDRLYMYGTLLSIPGENSLMTNNIVKLLPTLPGTYNNQISIDRHKYIVNITPCTAEGTPLDQVDLDQHYLEYGGNIRGMLGYQVDRYSTDTNIFPTVGNYNLSFMSFMAYCKYIRKINVNHTLNQPNTSDIHHIKFNTSVLNLIPLYKEAFKETSINKGYISLELYSEGNTRRETVHSITNFQSTYVECKKLTELDVIIDWYNNSIIPVDIISGTRYNIPGFFNQDNLGATCAWIIGNVRGCINLKKITLKYSGGRPYSNKILDLLNKIKEYITLNHYKGQLKLFHKGLTDNTMDYTIDIQEM